MKTRLGRRLVIKQQAVIVVVCEYDHCVSLALCFWKVQAVLLVICQWTPSATESLIVNWRGTMQVTTVCLVVGRWLFSPKSEVRQTAVNWLTGWILLVHTRHIGSDLWNHGGMQSTEVKF